MKKFEYKVIEAPTKGFFGGKIDCQKLTEQLNDEGREGWEAVSITNTYMYNYTSRPVIIILKRVLN
ncbi:MAG: DUF4177 domain-containing protein [Bacteroidota bacterium]|nr:DUF4177 domain-containing protein [Bacteroidota bacterium]